MEFLKFSSLTSLEKEKLLICWKAFLEEAINNIENGRATELKFLNKSTALKEMLEISFHTGFQRLFKGYTLSAEELTYTLLAFLREPLIYSSTKEIKKYSSVKRNFKLSCLLKELPLLSLELSCYQERLMKVKENLHDRKIKKDHLIKELFLKEALHREELQKITNQINQLKTS